MLSRKNKYVNDLELVPKTVGPERQLELLDDVLKNGNFLPKTVLYKDIDEAFNNFVENDLKIVSDEGKLFPTMTLFSNQRFSEYSQSWKYTDENNNLLLNFKTVSRGNNPEYGNIHEKKYNIPGDIFFLMKRKLVLDDNGTESILDLSMKMPTAVDFSYKVSIFTNKYEKINEFNQLINRLFASRQVYISPNGHYMPMILDQISEEDVNNIDDRRYYSQTFNIKLNGYILTDDDFKVEEKPLKFKENIQYLSKKRKKADVEIEECEEQVSPYYYKPIILTITYPECVTKAKFTIDTNFISESYELNNINNNYTIKVNSEQLEDKTKLNLKCGDVVEITITHHVSNKSSVFIINGYNKDIVYDERLDDEDDSEQYTEEIDVEADE